MGTFIGATEKVMYQESAWDARCHRDMIGRWVPCKSPYHYLAPTLNWRKLSASDASWLLNIVYDFTLIVSTIVANSFQGYKVTDVVSRSNIAARLHRRMSLVPYVLY